MAHQLRRDIAGLTTLAAVLALTGGCQLVVSFDRSRITDGGQGMDAGDGGGAVCGNMTVEVGEDCDDGRDGDDADGCTDACTFTCEADEDCQDTNVCNGAEVCALATHTCASGTAPADGTECGGAGMVCHNGDCITPVCGNAIPEPGEQCDDGNEIDTDPCTNDCRITCQTDPDCDDHDPCTGTETCDTTNNVCVLGTPLDDGESCGDDGQVCFNATCITPECGNAVVEPGETCDDGNMLACGSCNATCTGAGTGTCDDGEGCTADSDCTSGFCMDAANPADRACAPCAGDVDCEGSPAGGQCVDGDCQACDPDDDQGCEGANGQCVVDTCRACDPTTHDGCTGSNDRCRSDFTCVDCVTDDHCPGTQQCVNNVCRTCDPEDNAGCTGGNHCTDAFTCVACLDTGHCPGTQQCVGNVCRTCNPGTNAGCTAPTSQCTEGFTCVQCINNDHCSDGQRCQGNACVCDGTSCPTGCCQAGVCHIDDDNACGTGGGACTPCMDGETCEGAGCAPPPED